jgi:hypothetical protein
MNSLATALGFAAFGVVGAAAVSSGVSADALTQSWGIAEAWQRFARPLAVNGKAWLKARWQALLPEPTSPQGCADDRIQTTALPLQALDTQDGVALDAQAELIWRRLPVPRGRAGPLSPPLKVCAGLLKQAAEPALREAFRSKPLADLLQDRPSLGAAVCLSLRNSLRPHGLWVDTCGLDTLTPPSHVQAASDAQACVALRLRQALHRRARSRAWDALRPAI